MTPGAENKLNSVDVYKWLFTLNKHRRNHIDVGEVYKNVMGWGVGGCRGGGAQQ